MFYLKIYQKLYLPVPSKVQKNHTLQNEYLNVYEAEEHGLQKEWIARTKPQEQKQMT